MTNHITPYVVKGLRRDLGDSLSNSYIQGCMMYGLLICCVWKLRSAYCLYRIMVVMRAKFLVRKWNSVLRGLVEGLPA